MHLIKLDHRYVGLIYIVQSMATLFSKEKILDALKQGMYHIYLFDNF